MTQISIKKRLYAACPAILRPLWDRVDSSSLGNRMTKAAFWTLTGESLARGIRMVAVILLARILGQTVFGEFGMIRSTIMMFGIYAGFGMAGTATKHVAEFRQKDPEKAGRIIAFTNAVAILFSLFIGIFIVFASPWLAKELLNAPHLKTPLRIAAVALIFIGLKGAQTGALTGFEAFKKIANRNIIASIVAFPMLVVGAYLWGLKGAIIGFSTNIGFHWLITYFATKKEATKASVLIRFTGFKEHLRVFWTYSFPAVISGTMVAPVLWYARTTLTGSLNGYAELGVFEAAYSWLLIVNYISSKVSRSSFPILAKSYGDGNRLQFLKILKIQSLFNGVVTLFFAIIVAVFSKVIMGFYGEGFAQQNTVLIILSFTGVFMQLSLIMGLVNKSVGNIWYGAMLNGLWAFILIVGSESLSEYGAVGLSIAFLIAYAAHFIFTLIYVGLVFKFSPKLRKVSKDKIDAEKT